MRRVVVTGIGIASPLGIGSEAYWQALVGGTVAIGPLKLFDASAFPCSIGAEAPAYKISDFVPKSYRKGTKVMARDIELAVIAADDAFRSSGLKSPAYTDTPDIDGTRFGCNIGAGLISAELNELTGAMHNSRVDDKLDLKAWGTGMSSLTPLWLLKYLPNMLACHVTIIHQLKGPSNTITCGEASSHLAIGEAFRTIQRGHADLAICGGAESKLNPMALGRHCLLNRLNAKDNDRPGEALRPFDPTANGTVLGEGGGLLILEEYERAKARGAKIYAELAGFGASQDTYSVVDPSPDGNAVQRAIGTALKDANLPPAAVNLVIPHGEGIAAHDKSELAGLVQVFGNGLERVALAPIKGQTGNLSAGAGVDAATAALAVYHNKIPPAVNVPAKVGELSLNVSASARDADVNVAVSNVYSLGGQNAALVFKRID